MKLLKSKNSVSTVLFNTQFSQLTMDNLILNMYTWTYSHTHFTITDMVLFAFSSCMVQLLQKFNSYMYIKGKETRRKQDILSAPRLLDLSGYLPLKCYKQLFRTWIFWIKKDKNDNSLLNWKAQQRVGLCEQERNQKFVIYAVNNYLTWWSHPCISNIEKNLCGCRYKASITSQI